MRSHHFLLLSVYLLYGLTGCAPPAVSPIDTDSPEHYFRHGIQNLDAGDIEAAAEAFRLSVELDGGFARGWAGVGLAQAYLGASDDGEAAVNRAVALAPNDPRVWAMRGRFWVASRGSRSDWLNRAVEDLHQALSLDPDHERADFYLGEAYFYGLAFERSAEQFARVAGRGGDLARSAGQRWAVCRQIIEADPGSEAGRRIAIKPAITRAELAVLLVVELGLSQFIEHAAADTHPAFIPPSKLTSQDVMGHWAEPWISELLRQGVLVLDPSDNFAPDAVVTRVEWAQANQRILILVTQDMSLEVQYFRESPSRFTDVPSSHFAYNAMALSADRGLIMADAGTGHFRPFDHVSGVEALLIIRRLQSDLQGDDH
ncbi:MAG: S-layer homology domain-containing protein [Candidatus Marinimicrobia bacterium]|nr:S-layer homology domain-containing protein [Candidatus Neomarinimicrobiota bacterium]